MDPQEASSNMGVLATSFGQALGTLALTCNDLSSLWSRSNLHASGCKFSQLGLTHCSQPHVSHVITDGK